MNQLPIFVTLKGRKVLLMGEGEAADAKRRLIERAGGILCGPEDKDAVLAFVAIEDAAEAEAIASHLKRQRLLVNVVDQPSLCDFTTPAIVDRDPVLIAIGTGGASAGLAKALRQRLEMLLPQSLGRLATALFSARDAIRKRWPGNSERRKAIDAALNEGAALDPMKEFDDRALSVWLSHEGSAAPQCGRIVVRLESGDPDDLTLRQARLLGQADHIFHGPTVPIAILNRARADATRTVGIAVEPFPDGLVIQLVMDEEAL